MRLIGLLTGLLATLFVSLPSYAQGDTYLMAAMGDSITAATRADTTLVDPLPTQKIDTKALYSWSTGSQISSHFLRLQALLSTQGDQASLLNVAIPGERAAGLAAQAETIARTMRSGGFKAIKYVTLMIGSNDACRGTHLASLPQSLKAAFSILAGIQQSEPIRVLVSSVPRIPDLGKPDLAKTLTLHGTQSCTQYRDASMHMCDSLILWNHQSEYAVRSFAIDGFNLTLKKVVEETRGDFKNLDVVFSTAFSNLTLDTSLMAVDCFHPNAQGQALLSSLLWADQPWFK